MSRSLHISPPPPFFFSSQQLWYKVSSSVISFFSCSARVCNFLPAVFLSGNLESRSQLSSAGEKSRSTTGRHALEHKTGGHIMGWQQQQQQQQFTCGLTVTAPLQVCDLQLQASQHGQVLLLQEGNASLHTGHLLLESPGIHRWTPAELHTDVGSWFALRPAARFYLPPQLTASVSQFECWCRANTCKR